MLAFNIPGVTNLVLTREQIVGIYNGSITNWNHPTFVDRNPAVKFPNATIVPIARSDFSGATEIFTRALSSFSEDWTDGCNPLSEIKSWTYLEQASSSKHTLVAQAKSTNEKL